MTDLTPPITDAERRKEALRRITASPQTWDNLLELLVQAMREPAWVPPETFEHDLRERGWEHRNGRFSYRSSPEVIKEFAPLKPTEHPDWLLEMACDLFNKSAKQVDQRGIFNAIATALMTPPPKPPVDDATLCWREFMAGTSAPIAAKSYRTGSFDNHLTTATRQLFEHTLNWAKNREKRDD